MYIIYRIINRITDFPRNTKFFFQRIFRGYGDDDLWSLGSWILNKTRKPFKAFVKNQKEHGHKSYPVGLLSEKRIDIRKDDGYDRWINILEQIEEAIDLNWQEDNATDEWFAKTTEEHIKDNKKIAKGLELFGKYIRNFWD